MSFEEQYDAGRFQNTRGGPGMPPLSSPFQEEARSAAPPAASPQQRVSGSGGNAGSAPAASQPAGPYLRIVRASYGEGTHMVDVTDFLQQRIFDRGGLTLDEFGSSGHRMNSLFGDPSPGKDKQLLFSFEVIGSPKLLTKKEDMKMTLTMDHLYTKTTGKSPAPSETKMFCVNIHKATYGLGNSVYDVSSSLRIMVSEQGGKGLRAFGYSIKPNGCMNKIFGDPAPGKDKLLTIEYSWRTPILAYAIDEDKRVCLNFEPLRPLL